jgi:CheY-like chemotaxis protein
MRKILVVEDNEERIKWFKNRFKNDTLLVTKTAEEAIEILRDYPDWTCIFLDHDLGEGLSGVAVAKFLRESNNDSQVVLHTNNPCGRENMKSFLPNAVICQFTELR